MRASRRRWAPWHHTCCHAAAHAGQNHGGGKLKACAPLSIHCNLQKCTQDLIKFGFKFKEEDVYDIYGCLVNLGDLDDDPESSSKWMVLILTLANVTVRVLSSGS